MNFKFFVILIVCFGCGVKGDPVSPKNPPTSSFIENYPDITTDKPIDDVKRRAPQKRRKN